MIIRRSNLAEIKLGHEKIPYHVIFYEILGKVIKQVLIKGYSTITNGVSLIFFKPTSNAGVPQIQTGTLFSRIFIILLSLCALFVLFGRIVNIDNFSLTVWGDRDLWRGFEGLTNNHDNGRGPETNSGYRAFGGFFYHLLTFVFSIWADIRAANVAVTCLYSIAIIL